MCGASSQQKQIEQAQSNYYNTLTQQANQIFGYASSIFNELQSTFAPILAKGPNQEGFSDAEKQNLNNEIIKKSDMVDERYDIVTNHSKNATVQKAWDQKIDAAKKNPKGLVTDLL